ncbi:uncharacterized protein L969DRAFT_77832 [Mixia osmundae IAM 14324]|uniref:Cytochrome c oxidase subunit 4, mitochondrial n=1 Tax=Mixia osmundae (strain CBS 9802 / IAM 14324 / JCM 22182 / KY 12970) TaxID=764103 RepID=G7EA63_MIXOS|nr:uncharacterized protein L969DRAFT_77832 [Mixia osmundae IAM 14324]KEI37621.1 hypothetical protein L969DRAFT_77832 [Mixia osmundae IAM 14324]GAA99723.1 hypothetical protein E5Q_06426 [Mixia osmundae IAM 14324]
MMLRRSVAAVRVLARQPARSLATSVSRRSDHGGVPVFVGEGAKPGTVPTDLEQSTGLERIELLGKLQGVDIFDMSPLKVEHMGTLKNPIMVASLDKSRTVGCTGFPVDSHDTIYMVVPHQEQATRCPECGCAYAIDFQGIEEEHGHH